MEAYHENFKLGSGSRELVLIEAVK